MKKGEGWALDTGQVEERFKISILPASADNMINLAIRINQYEKRNFVF
jgi:hypothetical protein